MSQDPNCECITEARGVELRSPAEIDAEIEHYWMRLNALLEKSGRRGWAWSQREELHRWHRFSATQTTAPASPATA